MRPRSSAPIVADLVLVGGGHTHVEVLRRFAMHPIAGARVTLVGRDVHTPYSGMLPGLVAGHYEFDDAHVDVARLCRFAGARFLHAEAVGIDPSERRLLLRGRPPLGYDLLSLDVGSEPTLDVAGAAEHATPVKPVSRFLERWQHVLARSLEPEGATIVVVGTGAGGVELLLAAQHRIRAERRACGLDPDGVNFALLGADDALLATHPPGVRRRFARILDERGVDVGLGDAVVRLEAGRVVTASGAAYGADEVLWVTEAGAPAWLGPSGLALDRRGFVAVDPTLRSRSHESVFAAGDVAGVVEHPRPKAGVFAVRQGPPLAENLRRALEGRALRPFRPQRHFLSIVSTGDQNAVASRGGWSIEGPRVWRWKDAIDRRWMRRYQELDPGPETAVERPTVAIPDVTLASLLTHAQRCGGCGAKLGGAVLERVLDRLDAGRDEVPARDDATVLAVRPGETLVQSVDFFRAIVADPHLFGRIAATHALGDVFAMGAMPRTALAIATLVAASEPKLEEELFQLLSGAREVLEAEGATLAGGHSAEGQELALGLAVTGAVQAPMTVLTKGGLRPGDLLVLTKPLGTGVLFAAEMRLRARGRWIEAALVSMLASSGPAAACLRRHGITAATDVTGFGLVGHLAEMARASGVGASIRLDEVPVLEGALEVLAEGLTSSLHPSNRRRIAMLDTGGTAGPLVELAFDPQTAGGLLAGVPADRADECVAELRANGAPQASVIGQVEALRADAPPLRLDPPRR